MLQKHLHKMVRVHIGKNSTLTGVLEKTEKGKFIVKVGGKPVLILPQLVDVSELDVVTIVPRGVR